MIVYKPSKKKIIIQILISWLIVGFCLLLLSVLEHAFSVNSLILWAVVILITTILEIPDFFVKVRIDDARIAYFQPWLFLWWGADIQKIESIERTYMGTLMPQTCITFLSEGVFRKLSMYITMRLFDEKTVAQIVSELESRNPKIKIDAKTRSLLVNIAKH